MAFEITAEMGNPTQVLSIYNRIHQLQVTLLLGTYLECVYDIETLRDDVYNATLRELADLKKQHPLLYGQSVYRDVDPANGIIIYRKEEFPERIRIMAKHYLDNLDEPDFKEDADATARVSVP